MLAVPMVTAKSQSNLVKLLRRGAPLPWLLLGVALCVAFGIFAIARSRLNDERLRTANALKANDEVMARLRNVASEYAKSQTVLTELETRKEMLEQQVSELDQKTRVLGIELQELRRKKK